MLACLGDLVEDVIVRLAGPIDTASDTLAVIDRRRGGSAANVAATAAGDGRPARLLGQVGVDAIGGVLVAELADAGVDVSMVRRAGSTGTIVALVDPTGERSMLTDRRTCIDLADPDPSWLDGVDVLHVPFYSLVGGAIAATAETVIGWAHDRSIDVSIDASSRSLLRSAGRAEVRALFDLLAPRVVFANRDEAALLGIDGALGGATTIVKAGAAAAVVHLPDGRRIEVPTDPIAAPSDTTGAGDAFAAGYLTSDGWAVDPVAACTGGHRAAGALLRSRR